MVSGHLHEKNGFYYIILNITDMNGKRKPKWIATGLPVKGNKKRAEALLMEERKHYKSTPNLEDNDLLFADYMKHWLEIVKQSVATVTYSAYAAIVKTLVSYFYDTKITLSGLQARDIQEFYQGQIKRVKASTVIHYHSLLHKALKYAVKMDLIAVNPADKVERPKQEKFKGNFYDSDEINRLFEAVKDSNLEIPVMLGAFYGLRRSEIVGLKWDAIDYKNDTVTICHTVTECNVDGKHIEIARDTTKTKSSLRTLPLVPFFREKLKFLREQQEENRRICGRSYCKDYLDYICVDEMGERIKPNYITARFPVVLKQNNLRRIRFHDLRHSCASLLLANGVSMKQIQEWLGHSDFSTTANIYAHLDYSSKVSSANAMIQSLQLESEKR